MSHKELKPERSDVEGILGRRLRPWWGKSPGELIARGVIHGAFLGLLAYGCIQVLTDNVDLDSADLEEQRRWIELAATVGLVLAGIGIAYSLLRVVVGTIDIAPRTSVEGVLVQARRRYLGDVLPGPVRSLLETRRRYAARRNGRYEYDHHRRTRLEVIVETPDGPKSWNVRQKHFHESLVGQRVRLTASPLLGYVRSIEATANPSPTD